MSLTLDEVFLDRTEPFGVAVPVDFRVEEEVTLESEELALLDAAELVIRCFLTFLPRTFSSSSLDGYMSSCCWCLASSCAGEFSFWSSMLIRLLDERVESVPKDGARFSEWPRPFLLGEVNDPDRLMVGTARSDVVSQLMTLLVTPHGIVGKFEIVVVERRNLGPRLMQRDEAELR